MRRSIQGGGSKAVDFRQTKIFKSKRLMEIFALSTLLLAGAGVYLFARIFPNFRPGSKKIQADLRKMREELQETADTLIPLTAAELENLAAKPGEQNAKKGFTKKYRGIYTTIFHEPVVAYIYKKYLRSGKEALLLAKTARTDFYYWIRPKGIQLVINEKLIGTLQHDRKLYGGKNRRLIASLREEEEGYMPVIVGEREVGAIRKEAVEKEKSELSSRAFSYVAKELSEGEKALLMAYVILDLTQRQLQ